jgi:nitroreductase
MTTLGLSADELLSTTRAVRKRIDFDRPVEPALIEECLEFAVQAPTGSNRQGWRFLVVTDDDKKAALADLYRRGWELYSTMPASTGATRTKASDDRASQQMRVLDSASYLAENMYRVPAMLIPCMPGRVEHPTGTGIASMMASIIPSTWSFMLAERERGLGTCWTTIHLMFEEEAAAVLDIPFEKVSQIALITVGHTIGTDFTPATRSPASTVTDWNTWTA